MTLLRNNAKLLHFVHIPKTGGSSLERALRKAGAKRALHHHVRLGYSASTPQHMHAEVHSAFVPEDFFDYGLCVVRHPLSRLYSEYKWRIKLDQAKLPFDGWVKNQLRRYQKDAYILDNHFRPQTEFVGSGIEVFRFEDGLDKAIRAAADQLELHSVNNSTHVRTGPKIDVTWSAATRAAAIEFYRVDFETFGYAPTEEIPGMTVTG